MRLSRLVVHFMWLVAGIFVSLSSNIAYGVEPISSGMKLPQFTLDVPDSEEAKEYLGLKDLKSFSVSQIPAKLIFIEIFSLYCPHCHRKAPINNKIYRIIQGDQDLNRNVKMIGIGVGNNPRETSVFKNKFRVAFPVSPDPKFEINKKLGEPRTPFTIITTNSGKVLLTHQGDIKNVDEFVRQMKLLCKNP